MYSAVQTSFVHNESLSTTDDRGWSFNIPAGAHDLQVALAYADPAATPGVTPYLVNDLDLSLTDPSGTVHSLNDNLNNLRVMNITAPAAGTWEVHVVGTNVPTGPQFFSLAINHDVPLVNLTLDADLDGVEDSLDDCLNTPGTSTIDRTGCPDTDNDGYSDPDGAWTTANGADSCPTVVGSANQDRSGCPDDDGDGYSDPDPSGNNGPVWDVNDGADAFTGNATQWDD